MERLCAQDETQTWLFRVVCIKKWWHRNVGGLRDWASSLRAVGSLTMWCAACKVSAAGCSETRVEDQIQRVTSLFVETALWIPSAMMRQKDVCKFNGWT
jgi:hypothetical protein